MNPMHESKKSLANSPKGHRQEHPAHTPLNQAHLRPDYPKVTPEVRPHVLASRSETPFTLAASLPNELDDINTNGIQRDRAMLERATTAVRDNLLDAAQAASEAAYRARALADILDQSLAMLAADDGLNHSLVPTPGNRDADPTAELSEREREVLTHVAAGHSNKAIAQALYLSPNTVKTHVSSLLRKLNARSRAQLATFAAQQGIGA